MKHFKRSNIYKASNVTFNPETFEAYSYRWWLFVKRIKGKTIFNSYRYSVSTSQHQSKVRSLMSQLGIKIDRFVQVREGLNYISTIKELNQKESETLERIAANEERKRIRRNELARARRLALKLKNTPPILTLINGGAA